VAHLSATDDSKRRVVQTRMTVIIPFFAGGPDACGRQDRRAARVCHRGRRAGIRVAAPDKAPTAGMSLPTRPLEPPSVRNRHVCRRARRRQTNPNHDPTAARHVREIHRALIRPPARPARNHHSGSAAAQPRERARPQPAGSIPAGVSIPRIQVSFGCVKSSSCKTQSPPSSCSSSGAQPNMMIDPGCSTGPRAWAPNSALFLGLQERRPTREISPPRPKRPRFLLLNTVGKVVRHAREPLLRCTKQIARALARPPRTRFAFKRAALEADRK
jgi:hypothetical protein